MTVPQNPILILQYKLRVVDVSISVPTGWATQNEGAQDHAAQTAYHLLNDLRPTNLCTMFVAELSLSSSVREEKMHPNTQG